MSLPGIKGVFYMEPNAATALYNWVKEDLSLPDVSIDDFKNETPLNWYNKIILGKRVDNIEKIVDVLKQFESHMPQLERPRFRNELKNILKNTKDMEKRAKNGQMVLNALRLVWAAGNLGSWEYLIKDLEKFPGMSAATASILVKAGVTSDSIVRPMPEPLPSSAPNYGDLSDLRRETFELFDQVFKKTDLCPEITPSLFSEISTALWNASANGGPSRGGGDRLPGGGDRLP